MGKLSVLSLIAMAAAFSVAAPAKAAVWETRAHWSIDYEKKFGDFVAQTPLNFFTIDPVFGGMATDCADAAYSLRVIFASQEGLPVKFQSSDGKTVLSNETSDYDSIPEGSQRLLAFVNKVRRNTDTGTLMNETYSIAINRDSVRPGTMLIRSPTFAQGASSTFESGHAYIVQAVPPHGVVRLVSSTVPIAVRDLMVRNGIIFVPMNQKGGFRAWKWSDSDERPFASDEQFTFANWKPDSFRDTHLAWNWQVEITKRLQTRRATPKENMDMEIENINSVFSERAHIVQEGWEHYQTAYHGHGCMSDGDYEDFSTPSRDAAIQSELQLLDYWAHYYAPGGRLYYMKKLRLPIDTVGGTMSAADAREAFITNKAKVIMLSEPEHSPEVRWGLTVLPEADAPCPARIAKYLR